MSKELPNTTGKVVWNSSMSNFEKGGCSKWEWLVGTKPLHIKFRARHDKPPPSKIQGGGCMWNVNKTPCCSKHKTESGCGPPTCVLCKAGMWRIHINKSTIAWNPRHRWVRAGQALWLTFWAREGLVISKSAFAFDLFFHFFLLLHEKGEKRIKSH